MGLKKYRCGISVLSSTRDNEHALASLGESEKLSIENAPSRPPPWPGNHTCTGPAPPVDRRNTGIVSADKRAQETAEGVVGG